MLNGGDLFGGLGVGWLGNVGIGVRWDGGRRRGGQVCG